MHVPVCACASSRVRANVLALSCTPQELPAVKPPLLQQRDILQHLIEQGHSDILEILQTSGCSFSIPKLVAPNDPFFRETTLCSDAISPFSAAEDSFYRQTLTTGADGHTQTHTHTHTHTHSHSHTYTYTHIHTHTYTHPHTHTLSLAITRAHTHTTTGA